MQLDILILALRSYPERSARVAARLHELGLRFEIVEGLDAARIDLSDLEQRFGAKVASGGSPATPGDMACTLGHLEIWRRIASGKGPGAIVLEDDAILADDFAKWATTDASDRMAALGTELLRLEARPEERLVGRRLDSDIWRICSPVFGSAGYVLSRRGAQSLVTKFDPPARPVDHLLFGPLSPARKRLKPAVLRPAVVWQEATDLPSLIAPERDIFGTRRKTWRDRAARLVTRAALATGRAELVEAHHPAATLRPRNEPGTSL